MKAITKEKAKIKTQKFLAPGGPFDRFKKEKEKAIKELKKYLDGGPRPSWLASFDMIPAGNRKTNLPTFGTYAGHGCAAACPGCYAMGGWYVSTGLIKGRARRVALLEIAPALFWDVFVKNLNSKIKAGARVVRLFDAGDLPGVEFLESLAAVARRFPAVRFYGYTKNFRILDAVALPKNLVFMRSHFLTPAGDDKRAVFLTVDVNAGPAAPANFKKCPGGNCAGCSLCASGALVWAPLHD